MHMHYRIYLGNVNSREAVERIMDAVRDEFRPDYVGWYALEESRPVVNDHPRNPGTRWREIEGDE